MKRSAGVIAGALGILLAACGSNSPTATTPPTARTSTQAATRAPNLSAELLAVSDLPVGWSVVPSSSSGSATPKCLQNVQTDLKATSRAEATFEDNGLPVLAEYLAYLPGQGQQAMTAISHLLGGCGQISLTSDGQTLTGTVGAMSYPAVADQSSAYQM